MTERLRTASELAELLGLSAATVKLALSPSEAASMLSISRDSFDRHVKPELRLVRRGRIVLVPVSELQRWLERAAARTLEPQ